MKFGDHIITLHGKLNVIWRPLNHGVLGGKCNLETTVRCSINMLSQITFTSRYTKIMLSPNYIYLPVQINYVVLKYIFTSRYSINMCSPNYIYLSMQYNFVVCKLHLPSHTVQLCCFQITFTSRNNIIMWSPKFIYLSMQYNYVVFKLHLPPNTV